MFPPDRSQRWIDPSGTMFFAHVRPVDAFAHWVDGDPVRQCLQSADELFEA